MTEWLILFSDIMAGAVRMTVGLLLVLRLLSARRTGRKYMAAAGIDSVVLSVLLAAAAVPESCRIGAEIAGIVSCAVYLLQTELRMSLFLGIYYEIAVFFWKFLAAAWLGVLLHSPVFLDTATAEGQAAFWLFHVLLAGAAFFLWHHPRQVDRGIGFAAVGLLAVVTLSEQNVLVIEEDVLVTWTLQSVILLTAGLVFSTSRQYETEKKLAKLEAERTELLERDYITLNNAYTLNAKLFHDFHNHIGVLRQLLAHRKTEEAIAYLDELQAPLREMADTVWTGEETIDYLINSKAVAARRNEIAYQVQVEFPDHTNLRSADLCAILGNLLDNALEAAVQVPEREQRFVHLTIRRINQMLVIKVENSLAAAPLWECGGLKTTKTEDGLHGWGLKSARAAAGKYDGVVQTSCTDDVFQTVVVLAFETVPARKEDGTV